MTTAPFPVSEEQLEALGAAGFDVSWLRSMIVKHGTAVLDAIETLMNVGFNVEWIVGAIGKLHPLMTDVFAHVFAAPAAVDAATLKASGLFSGTPDDSLPTKATTLESPMAIFFVSKLIEILPATGLTGWKLTIATYVLKLLLSAITPKAA